METNLQEELRAILERYERYMDCEYHTPPGDIDYKPEFEDFPREEHIDFDEAEAIASLTSLMNEYAIERLEELKEIKRHPQWGTEPHYVAHEDIEAMQERLAKGQDK